MNESLQNWSSPWRTLQQTLANQFRTAQYGTTGETPGCGSSDDAVIDTPSWIKRARLRQLQPRSPRQ
jgi:hypothetical protein